MSEAMALNHDEYTDAKAAEAANDRLLTSAQLRHRWGDVSEMFLWRRRLDPEMPKPIVLGAGKNARRFWRLSEIVSYERRRQEGVADANP